MDAQIGDAVNIREFREQRVIAVIGLTILTFGIYPAFWLGRQARVIARLLPQSHLSAGLLGLVYVLAFVSTLWLVPELLYDDKPVITQIGDLVGWIYRVCYLVIAFKIRNRMHTILGFRPGDSRWFSGVAMFFRSMFYLQYKINRVREGTPMGFCAQCGYNLTGLPEPRCPECGTPFDPASHRIVLARPPVQQEPME